MHGTSRRRLAVVLAGLAGFAGHVGNAVAGGGFTDGPGTTDDPPLTQAEQLTLHGSGGDIQVVVYHGNERATTSTTLTGFTVPAGSITARTTYVVVDGQCGSRSANGCAGVQTGGSGDTLAFLGGAGSLSDGPDAFKGSDPCPWGPDTCLWDTRTFDVSGDMAAGDTSAVATVASGFAADGQDCINHEAQVFAVGPSAAWSTAGYVAAGAGLRNQASGSISIAGIPAGARIAKALLYWNVLNSGDPGGGISVNGAGFGGQLVAAGPDPCWDGGSWAYRADVTSAVSGNGGYTISGYPTGTVGGQPWAGSATPMMEGASLVVFYERPPAFRVSFSTFIPTDHVPGPPQAFCFDRPSLFPPRVVKRDLVFAGDNRTFDPNATSYRTRQTAAVVSEQSADADGILDSTPPTNRIGESRAYADDALADGKIDSADDDAVLNDCHLLHARGTASTSNMHVDVTRVNAHAVKVHMYGGASNPLVLGAPAIDWDLTLTVDTSGSTPHWTLIGDHDGFPAYEVYVDGKTLYTYSPGPGPYSFFDLLKLFPPLDVHVDASGDLN